MNNDAFLDPKECSQNKIPLKDINPDYETYESQPPEIIPIGSSDYQENNTIQKINTQKNKHINNLLQILFTFMQVVYVHH